MMTRLPSAVFLKNAGMISRRLLIESFLLHSFPTSLHVLFLFLLLFPSPFLSLPLSLFLSLFPFLFPSPLPFPSLSHHLHHHILVFHFLLPTRSIFSSVPSLFYYFLLILFQNFSPSPQMLRPWI